MKTKHQKSKILVLDIETSLMELYAHCIGYNQTVGYHQIKKHRGIVCIAYKWLGEKEIHVLTWDPITQDDSKLLEEFNKVAAKADLLLAHNGLGFDIKEIRGYIALRGLAKGWCETPCIDTLQKFRKLFRFPSNRLDNVAKLLGIGQKSKMEFQDWIDVSEGDIVKLTKMVRYCKNDVRLLERIYRRLEKYMPKQGKDLLKHSKRTPVSCSHCDSEDIVKNGTYTNSGGVYQKWICRSCFKTTRQEV